MADKCDPLRDEVEHRKEVLKRTPKFDDPEPGRKPTTISQAFEDATVNLREAEKNLRQCIESLHIPKPPPPPPPTPVPLMLTLTHFVCIEQNEKTFSPPFLNAFDEPYACILAVDLKVPLNSKVTLVGPIQAVESGREREAPPNVIWGLSNAPDLVSEADNLILLVAMLENDDGSPDQARSTLDDTIKVELGKQLPLFIATKIPREELVRRLIAGMQGSMQFAVVGAPNFDDQIGPIQELRYIRGELDRLYKGTPSVQKDLTFEGNDAKYVLRFQLSR